MIPPLVQTSPHNAEHPCSNNHLSISVPTSPSQQLSPHMFGFLHRLLGDCILNLLLPGKVPVTANTEKEDSQHVNSPESIGEEMTAGLTVPLLKARCKELGLPVSGRKADLISRIEAHVQVPKARQTDSDPSDTPQKRKEATTENPKPKKKSKNIIEASATRLGGEQFDCVQGTSLQAFLNMLSRP